MANVGGYSQAAVPSVRVPIKVNSALLNGQELDSASEYNTAWVAPKGADRIGLFINIASEDSSAGTLDVDVEYSPDKGTTVVGFPISANSETESSLAQFTAAGSKFKWWEACTDGEFSRVRAELTQGGLTASEGFTYGPSFWILANVD